MLLLAPGPEAQAALRGPARFTILEAALALARDVAVDLAAAGRRARRHQRDREERSHQPHR